MNNVIMLDDARAERQRRQQIERDGFEDIPVSQRDQLGAAVMRLTAMALDAYRLAAVARAAGEAETAEALTAAASEALGAASRVTAEIAALEA